MAETLLYDLEVYLVNDEKLSWEKVTSVRLGCNYKDEMELTVKTKPGEDEERTVEIKNLEIAGVMLARSDIAHPDPSLSEADENVADNQEGSEGGGPKNVGQALPAGAPTTQEDTKEAD